MEILDINKVEEIVMKLFRRIPNHKQVSFLISFKENKYDCMPFISIDTKGYHLKCYERGKLIQDDIMQDLDELLYRIFRDITFEEACKFELKNRLRYQDNRRLIFSKQLELLQCISDDFARRRKLELDKILQSSPFDDNYSSIFDLIDDFEHIAAHLNEIYQKQNISKRYCEKEVKNIIGEISRLHREGTSDISKFCKDIIEKIKLVYLELKNNPSLHIEIKLQLDKIEDTLKIAENVFNISFLENRYKLYKK
ncbi:hypothetical protein HMPREF1982_03401 [Clostridiales bacterium oral taxon 876 str. F0540]|nr:hypothetical protein HMPREF1982_03401 [Clostridiales bacterium oral taxon 876 str. F0540]